MPTKEREAEVTRLHQSAMDLAHRADRVNHQAMEMERRAATYLLNDSEEPTRSILFRSAAELAWVAREPEESGRLAALGLSPATPGDIAEELRDAIDRADGRVMRWVPVGARLPRPGHPVPVWGDLFNEYDHPVTATICGCHGKWVAEGDTGEEDEEALLRRLVGNVTHWLDWSPPAGTEG